MKLHIKMPILFVFTALVSLTATAQNSPARSTTIETQAGQRYYIHTVEKGQTLYAISKLYDVPLNEIIRSNEGISKNIHPGETIRLPAKQAADHQNQKPESAGMSLRRVARGETVFSLAKEYNVSVGEILAANDGLPEGLKEGEFIRIPDSGNPPANPPQKVQTETEQAVTDTESPAEISQPRPALQQPEETENGYFEFQERNRETLYELAIRYRISIDSIYAINPGISDQLSRGQIIKIPYSTVENDYITHTARRRITVNRLARFYNIDLEKIRQINPYMSRQLQTGQAIRIPLPPKKVTDEVETDSLRIIEQQIRKESEREISQKEFCSRLMEKGQYNIALMIPFFLEENSFTNEETDSQSASDEDAGFIRPFLFIQFYEGLLLAVDSLKQLGFNAEIHVFDVEDDVAATQKVLEDPRMEKMHLIIGPFYQTSFRMTANFAKTNQIPIVNPFSTRTDIIVDNPYVIKVQPDENSLFQTLVDFLNHRHKSSQIFIARHNSFRDEIQFGQLKNILNKELETRQYPFTNLYHEIVYTQDSVYTFLHQASVSNENVVVIYSDNKIFAFDILRKLNQLRDTFNITVIGIPGWKDIEGFDYRHKNNLNTHLLTPEHVDYESQVVKDFVRRFRATYHTEPENYAFAGYDIGIYFLSALMKFGKHFTDCLPWYEMDALHYGFRFRGDDNTGFENQHLKVLRMTDFQYREIFTTLPVYDLGEEN
jgi:LysM repeat protein/ABC-type branched-subunit amino acid transport system substrate-binding protein